MAFSVLGNLLQIIGTVSEKSIRQLVMPLPQHHLSLQLTQMLQLEL